MEACKKEGTHSPTLSPSNQVQNEKSIVTNGNNVARFSATNDVQAKDCRHLDCRHTSRRRRVSAAVKALVALLLQRDCALAAMGRRLRYENSTEMRRRGAGKIVRGCAFFERSVGATSVQVYNRHTTTTRPRRGSTIAAQPCYHRTPATRRGSKAAALRGTAKSATSLLRGGTTTRQLHGGTTRAQLLKLRTSVRSPVRGGATATHPYEHGAAATGPLLD